MTYVVVDIETTTASLYGRKASPFLESNYIVALGYRPKGLKTVGEYFPSYHKENLFDCVRGFKLLVGHNIKFDIMHMIQNANARKQFLEWVAGGGMVWDTQLAEYLLRGCEQTSHMLSLDQVAPAYGGTHKVDAVKLLWEQGVDTPDIPQDLLMRYLVGDAEYPGDIGNTELVFLGQVEKARQVGQMQSIMLNMDALLFTIEAEFNGMSVNKPLGLDIAAQLRKDIAGAKERLDASLPKDLPFEFNWGSAQQLSALIFGGAVKYPAKFYKHQDGTSTKVDEWHEGMPALWYTMKTVERPLLDGAGEPVRFKGGKQAGQVKTCKVSVPDLEKGPKTRMEEAVYRFKGYTAAKPQWAGAVPGVYSVSSDVIEELGNRNIPFLKELSEFQAMQKDLSTYYISEDGSKGLLTLVGEDGLVHHNLNMCSTVTGRLSSSRPNLQNVSKGNKSRVKELFVSRYPGGSIIQSDFTSLEVYIQAWLSRCKNLINDLKAGIDMHCMRLATKEKMPYEEVLKLCKGPAAVKEWEYKRTAAKVLSFQKAYGAGNTKIAESTGMSLEEVEAFSAAEDERYPEIQAYFKRLEKECKAHAKPQRVIKHPLFPNMICHIGKAVLKTPDGKAYAYFQEPAPGWLVKKGITASFSPTQIKNYSVQGMGAEVAKAAMALVLREFAKRGNFHGRACIVNQCHDAIYVDAHPDVFKEAAQVLHTCMTQASTYFEELFKWEIPVPVPAETKAGSCMAEENVLDFLY